MFDNYGQGLLKRNRMSLIASHNGINLDLVLEFIKTVIMIEIFWVAFLSEEFPMCRF